MLRPLCIPLGLNPRRLRLTPPPRDALAPRRPCTTTGSMFVGSFPPPPSCCRDSASAGAIPALRQATVIVRIPITARQLMRRTPRGAASRLDRMLMSLRIGGRYGSRRLPWLIPCDTVCRAALQHSGFPDESSGGQEVPVKPEDRARAGPAGALQAGRSSAPMRLVFPAPVFRPSVAAGLFDVADL